MTENEFREFMKKELDYETDHVLDPDYLEHVIKTRDSIGSEVHRVLYIDTILKFVEEYENLVSASLA